MSKFNVGDKVTNIAVPGSGVGTLVCVVSSYRNDDTWEVRLSDGSFSYWQESYLQLNQQVNPPASMGPTNNVPSPKYKVGEAVMYSNNPSSAAIITGIIQSVIFDHVLWDYKYEVQYNPYNNPFITSVYIMESYIVGRPIANQPPATSTPKPLYAVGDKVCWRDDLNNSMHDGDIQAVLGYDIAKNCYTYLFNAIVHGINTTINISENEIIMKYPTLTVAPSQQPPKNGTNVQSSSGFRSLNPSDLPPYTHDIDFTKETIEPEWADKPKCTCGSHSVGSNSHSSWCDIK